MTMNRDVEIYTPGGAAGSIQLVHTGRDVQFYPHWHVLPDGRALMGGPGRSDSAFFDLSTYQFTDLPLLPEARTGFGSGVLLPGPPSGPTTAFLAGGGSHAEHAPPQSAEPVGRLDQRRPPAPDPAQPQHGDPA